MFSRFANTARLASRFTAQRNASQVASTVSKTSNTTKYWIGAGAVAVGGAVFVANSETSKAEQLPNSAFVFVKPHAVTERTKALVETGLGAQGIAITDLGSLSSEEIDEKKLIDQHYYAIASKATILKPEQLNVPADKFKAQFGLEWKDALAQGKVFNAMDACKKLGITAEQLNTAWATSKKSKKMVKFGGGFYCGLVEVEGKDPVYVFNGFFMSMRSKFTQPGGQIAYYVVEWDADRTSWSDFRGKVLGPTDPSEAPKTSLRGQILAEWESLGLASVPNVGDNGVHASASPFEALAERNNWLGVPIESDAFGSALVAAGVPASVIGEWSVDPQVMVDGKKGSLFDALEDLDTAACIDKCVAIAKENGVYSEVSSNASANDDGLFLILGGGAAAIGGVASACFAML